MKPFLLRFSAVVLLMAVAGCSTTSEAPKPTASSHEHVTADGSHWAVQISMHSGIANTPRQTAMIIYNKYSKTPIAIVNGQTKPMSEKLMDDIITAVTSYGTAFVTGNFMLQASKADCPSGGVCGTLVQVSNQAGASAAADAASNSE